MRENRPYGLEGGEAGSTGLPYPYAWGRGIRPGAGEFSRGQGNAG